MKITVTGQSGTGSTSAGRCLATKLGLTFYSAGEIVRSMAERLHMDIHEFDTYIQQHPEYDAEIDKQQRQFGEAHNDFVLESRLGWFFVPSSVKILVTCGIEKRIHRVCEKENIGEQKARMQIEAREKSQLERFNNLYGIEDPWGAHHFDIVEHSSATSPETLAERMVAAIRERQLG
jgi:CMP/dCMP kinase